MRRSSSASACSAACRASTASARRSCAASTPSASASSCSRTARAWASSSSGSRPGARLGLGLEEQTAAVRREASAVPCSRSRRLDRRYQVSWVRARRGDAAAAAISAVASRAWAACQGLLDLAPALAQRGLVGDLPVERRDGLHEVVGEEPGPRVRAGRPGRPAARRATSACRPSGLSWRRISLVRSASRVRLACIASSLRSAFSLRLRCLRTPGGLLDEAAAVLGGGVQDGVELALADDDVHLAADPGVAEQLLDVEQAAARAVDRVLRPAVAEHRPRDRHLGVVDRQRAVGVVDGQGDLGAARAAAGRRCRRR